MDFSAFVAGYVSTAKEFSESMNKEHYPRLEKKL